MKMEEEQEAEKENGERWVLTYADMITLLMVFFIVMYSMSTIDAKKYSAVAEQLSIALGGSTKSMLSEGAGANTNHLSSESLTKGMAPINPSGENSTSTVTPTTTPDTNSLQSGNGNDQGSAGANAAEAKILDDVQKKIRDFIDSQSLSAQVTVSKDTRGTVISFTEALLFDIGSADIQANRVVVINKIAEIISQTANFIRVEGFTDNIPINTSRYPSNWELAAQRSINVGKTLVNTGINPERISCLSYGQYRPSVANDSEDNRRRNRRVDIILIYKTLDNLEPGMNHN